jgi:hypothetical protein
MLNKTPRALITQLPIEINFCNQSLIFTTTMEISKSGLLAANTEMKQPSRKKNLM